MIAYNLYRKKRVNIMNKEFLKITTILCSLSVLPSSLLAIVDGSTSQSNDNVYVYAEAEKKKNHMHASTDANLNKSNNNGNYVYGQQYRDKSFTRTDYDDFSTYRSTHGHIDSAQDGKYSSIGRENEVYIVKERFSAEISKNKSYYIENEGNYLGINKNSHKGAIETEDSIAAHKDKDLNLHISKEGQDTIFIEGGAGKTITRDLNNPHDPLDDEDIRGLTVGLNQEKSISQGDNSIDYSKDVKATKTEGSSASTVTITTNVNDNEVTKNIGVSYGGDGTTTYTGESGDTATRTIDSTTGEVTFSGNNQTHTITPPSRPKRAAW